MPPRLELPSGELGAKFGAVRAEEREGMLAELDACAALLYGLDEDDIGVLYGTFGRPGQHDARRDAVIGHWRRITGSQR